MTTRIEVGAPPEPVKKALATWGWKPDAYAAGIYLKEGAQLPWPDAIQMQAVSAPPVVAAIRKGTKTSEFWLAVAGILGALGTAAGALITQYEHAPWMAVVGPLMAAQLAKWYTDARKKAKELAEKEAKVAKP